ncbi:hypothetical protein ABEF95_017262 [Exophiala dermatitidis]
MSLSRLVATLFLVLLNVLAPAYVLIFNTLTSLFLLFLSHGRRFTRHMQRDGRREVSKAAEWAYFAFLVSLTWVLSIGTGQHIRVRYLLPESPVILPELTQIWANVKQGVMAEYSVLLLPVARAMASIRKLFAWKRSKQATGGGAKTTSVQIDDSLQATSSQDEVLVCLLCQEEIPRQNPSLYLCCSKQHCYHASCAADSVMGRRRCHVCEEPFPDAQGPQTPDNEAGAGPKKSVKKKNRNRNKKRKH